MVSLLGFLPASDGTLATPLPVQQQKQHQGSVLDEPPPPPAHPHDPQSASYATHRDASSTASSGFEHREQHYQGQQHYGRQTDPRLPPSWAAGGPPYVVWVDGVPPDTPRSMVAEVFKMAKVRLLGGWVQRCCPQCHW
jgi:hypothetical protein